MNDKIERAKEMLATARSITVLTGAGISAESGIATYRDADGLWNNYRAEDFSSVDAFQKDPKMVWSWYKERRRIMAEAEPNAGHKALATLEQRGMTQFMVLTQNIDGLHQRGGTDNIVELHGSVWRLCCTYCPNEWEDRDMALPDLPTCPKCDSIARPDVVWFGESLKPMNWGQAMRATYCDVLLVVGTSAMVNPVASIPMMAIQNRARVIVVNKEEIPLVSDVFLQGNAGEILPQLAEEVTSISGLHEMDLGKAMKRGLDKFYQKYPELKKSVEGSGGKVE